MTRGSIAIILVGPRLLIREGIARILLAENFHIIASVSDIETIGPGSIPLHQSLLLMIDATEDTATAISQIARFKSDHPAGRVVVMNERSEPAAMISALRAGAHAYLTNVENCDAFVKTLEVVMLGETLLWSGNLVHILDHSLRAHSGDHAADPKELAAAKPNRAPLLSARQQYILQCLAEGATNRVIANKIAVEEATVKVHVRTVLQKIRARNRTQAAVWALNNGLSTVKAAKLSNEFAQRRAQG